uniref:Uncharacterized protein n=1 Tax=Avena sativa TaxID=4498 RepID=A0ACD5T7I8_AVESA
MLKRDSKTICQTKVYGLPNSSKVPSDWPIIKFVPVEEYQQNDIRKFSLLPDPEDDKQTKEWGRFMRYLRESKKVNIISTLWILSNLLMIDMEDTKYATYSTFKSPFQEKQWEIWAIT